MYLRPIDSLIKALDSDNPTRRRNAVFELGEINSKEAIEHLVKMLEDIDWNVRFKAIVSLGKIDDDKVLYPILKCFNDKSANVRRKAVEVIGIMSTGNKIPTLKEIESGYKPKEKNNNFSEIMHSEEIFNSLIKTLKDKNPRVRAAAAKSLGKIRDKRAVYNLKMLLEDADAQVRESAGKAIYYIKFGVPKKKVPVWSEYFIDKTATPDQREFYTNWLFELNKGNYIDIEGNLAYIYYYLDSVINNLIETKNINYFLECLNKIREGYGNKRLDKYLVNLESDSYFLLGDYEKSIKVRKKIGFKLHDVVIYAKMLPKSKEYLLDGNFLVNIDVNALTDLGKKNKKGIAKYATAILNDLKRKHGKNIFKHYLEDVFNEKHGICGFSKNRDIIIRNFNENAINQLKDYLTNMAFLKLKRDYNSYYESRTILLQIEEKSLNNGLLNCLKKYLIKKDYLELKEIIELNESLENFSELNTYNITYYAETKRIPENDLEKLKMFCPDKESYLKLKSQYDDFRKMDEELFNFVGPSGLCINSNGFSLCRYIPWGVLNAIEKEIVRILRDSENDFRDSIKVPKIGEGWISETELFYKIKNAFPEEEVVHHGKPIWLGKQHLDIYFPKKKIGIEYQGEQHQEPIDYFGGKESFEKMRELDEKKKRLCKENHCNLIYIYPDYDFEDVKKSIENFIVSH